MCLRVLVHLSLVGGLPLDVYIIVYNVRIDYTVDLSSYDSVGLVYPPIQNRSSMIVDSVDRE